MTFLLPAFLAIMHLFLGKKNILGHCFRVASTLFYHGKIVRQFPKRNIFHKLFEKSLRVYDACSYRLVLHFLLRRKRATGPTAFSASRKAGNRPDCIFRFAESGQQARLHFLLCRKRAAGPTAFSASQKAGNRPDCIFCFAESGQQDSICIYLSLSGKDKY